MAGPPEFIEDTKKTQDRFEAKEREFDNFTFAGIEIQTIPDGILLHQPTYCRKITPLPEDATFADFRSKRHQLSWLVHTRPYLPVATNLAAQTTEAKFPRTDINKLNKTIKRAHAKADRGILQRKLNLPSLAVWAFSDSSFANTPDLKSQLGYIVLLVDQDKRCNILHFSSHKSKRVTRSVVGAEIYAFAEAFDFAYTIRHDLENILGKRLPISMFRDSKILFDIITKSTSTTEKRLMIDVSSVREASDKSEISDIGFIWSEQNPADALTKVIESSPLDKILDEGVIDVKVDQWILRNSAIQPTKQITVADQDFHPPQGIDQVNFSLRTMPMSPLMCLALSNLRLYLYSKCWSVSRVLTLPSHHFQCLSALEGDVAQNQVFHTNRDQNIPANRER